jgi:integrase
VARTPKPYETNQGRRWRIGYRDEQGIERTRGGFLRQSHASDWYRRLEHARSESRLKQFLDEDAGLPPEQVETLHDFMIDWFRLDAAPELATATATTYLHVYNKHLRPLAGHRPLEDFELPGPVTNVLGQMAAAGVGQATRDNARKVLSSAFGWGVEMGRLRANGARSVRRNRRRSRRLTAAEARPAGHQEAAARRKAWALAPEAFAALHRAALDRRTPGRPTWMPARDAIAMSMLYGLGLRPQELFGATFRQASPSRFRVAQVLTKATDGPDSTKPVGRIIPAAKTADGVRTMAMREWLYADLLLWRDLLGAVGLPVDDDDFIVPGAARDGHYTLEQQHNFIRDMKACGRVAASGDPSMAFLVRATPYSLRRGHISLRVLAGEDIRRIADDCGTSTAMIHRHYLYELDMRHEKPEGFIFDGAVEAARRALRDGARIRAAGEPACACASQAARRCLHSGL